ncbi:MAG TPA: winged helix-turn-helix domain-containing protein [Candidatus Thermoplasmatota archaeon]|nr:winged helix-turn-helix domain-containing protein [Candidatus Thermoplasmatota archaeon]
MSESKITLDRATFKALASDTRLDILKLLDTRQMTVSEIGRALDLNKATCFEHLTKLVEAGLVNKLEDDRKWVYYQLTWTGRRILNPEKITFALLLSSSFAALVTGIAALWLWFKGTVREVAAPPGGAGAADAETMRGFNAPEETVPADQVSQVIQDPALLVAALVLFAVVLLLAGLAFNTLRKAKAREAL